MKKTIYVDMDNVLVDFPSAFPKVDPKLLKKYEGDYDDIPGIFELMDPVEGAIEAFIKLTQHYDTYILSTSPWHNPSAWQHKVEWVQKYLTPYAYKRLILTHNKNLNKGDYLIDDREKNGAREFEGEHVIFGSDRFKGWHEVLQYLLPNVSPRLEKAIQLMEKAHARQKDKAGFPYREHPLYLSRQLENESEKIVALLHDVFEDTDTVLDEVNFLTDEERQALQIITKVPGVEYENYIQKVKQNYLARAVKIQDLRHNLTDRGYKAPEGKIKKYKWSLDTLEKN